eukprot:m.926365 g.926365  ORF g.926365 m.926365 type:complete len:100 (-) comp139157_c0_seq1:286-585(-)
MSVGQQHHLRDEADAKDQCNRQQDQTQPTVGLALFGRHGYQWPWTILVAEASSLGGSSKVWNGAGDGTSHSRPSAASQGFCGAFSPLPRIIGTTMNRKK